MPEVVEVVVTDVVVDVSDVLEGEAAGGSCAAASVGAAVAAGGGLSATCAGAGEVDSDDWAPQPTRPATPNSETRAVKAKRFIYVPPETKISLIGQTDIDRWNIQ